MPIQKITSGIIQDGAVAAADIVSVANTAISGLITASQIAAVNGSVITANTIANSAIQTDAVENYIASTGRTLTNRNLIINGAMQIAQRNTSVTNITTGNYRTADRWYFFVSSTGTWTMNVESSAPTNTEFRNSSNVICTTADSSLSAGDELAIIQNIEGFNCQGIKKGTTNAESITVSFWVKSSNTGTFICELRDEDNSRHISKTYTINAANTWEKETITFPPDTTGAFDNDNNSSLRLFMWLAAGSNFTSGTLNSTAWASSVNANRVVGQLNLANRVGNYLAITGVQLETGTVATPFEIRPYGTEFALCQRYFETSADFGNNAQYDGQQIVVGVGGTTFGGAVAFCQGKPFSVRKRTAPTVVLYYQDGSAGNVYRIDNAAKIAGVALYLNPAGFLYTYSSTSAFNQGYGYYYSFTADAEL
jgi:hypothetical protein